MSKLKFTFSLLLFLFSGIQFTGLNYVNDVYSQEIDESGLAVETPFQIQIKRDITFASNDDVLIGTIYPIYVDGENRVFIGDADQIQIHVFEANGDYITSLGREGRGPGDYSAISLRTTITSDSGLLYITDSRFFNSRRANVYSLKDLSFSHTIKLLANNVGEFSMLKGYSSVAIYPRKDESFLVSYSLTMKNAVTGTGAIYYLKQDKGGNIISEPIYEQQGISYLVERIPTKNGNWMEVMHTFPFHERSLFLASNDGNYYAARTEEFKIDVLDKEGNLIRTITHPFDNKSLDINALIKRYEETNYMPQLGEGVAVEMLRVAENLPTEWPALKSLLADDENRLWVSTIIDDTEVYEWWVLESSGKILTKFKWPRDKPIQQIRNEYLYTKEKGQDGADIVVRYSFDLGR